MPNDPVKSRLPDASRRIMKRAVGERTNQMATVARVMLLVGLLAGGAALSAALAQSGEEKAKPAARTTKPAVTGTPTRYLPNRFAGRAGLYYKAVWGVDSLSVKTVESGEIIRFAWRVLDPNRAQVLNDKKAEPALIDPKAGVQLVVPSMEQI